MVFNEMPARTVFKDWVLLEAALSCLTRVERPAVSWPVVPDRLVAVPRLLRRSADVLDALLKEFATRLRGAKIADVLLVVPLALLGTLEEMLLERSDALREEVGGVGRLDAWLAILEGMLATILLALGMLPLGVATPLTVSRVPGALSGLEITILAAPWMLPPGIEIGRPPKFAPRAGAAAAAALMATIGEALEKRGPQLRTARGMKKDNI